MTLIGNKPAQNGELLRAGTFHSNLPKIVQTLRYALLHKDKRTFADASEAKADWWGPITSSPSLAL